VSIFARDIGKHVTFLIATCEPDEAVLIQAKVNAEDLAEWLEDPERIGKCMGNGGDQDEPCPDP
jgi:hypothetical protein